MSAGRQTSGAWREFASIIQAGRIESGDLETFVSATGDYYSTQAP